MTILLFLSLFLVVHFIGHTHTRTHTYERQKKTFVAAVAAGHFIPDLPMDQAVIKDACGDITPTLDEDDEQEEMFVDAHQSLGHGEKEWGGPTRGGRLAEPTRFGDWERKGRCTDF